MTLKSIAAEIAKRAGFSLMYEAHNNPKYDRQDQTDVSDLSFLNDLCKQEGIALKVTGKKLVLFDEYVYEQKPPALTIERGVSDIISYGFTFSTQDVAYAGCEVSYQPAAKKSTSKKKMIRVQQKLLLNQLLRIQKRRKRNPSSQSLLRLFIVRLALRKMDQS